MTFARSRRHATANITPVCLCERLILLLLLPLLSPPCGACACRMSARSWGLHRENLQGGGDLAHYMQDMIEKDFIVKRVMENGYK